MLLCLEQRARSGRFLARRALPQLAHCVSATRYAYPWPDQPEYASVCDGPPPPSTHATAVDVRAPLSDLYGHVNPRAGVCASLTYRTRSSVARGGPGRAWRGLIPRVFKRFGEKCRFGRHVETAGPRVVLLAVSPLAGNVFAPCLRDALCTAFCTADGPIVDGGTH